MKQPNIEQTYIKIMSNFPQASKFQKRTKLFKFELISTKIGDSASEKNGPSDSEVLSCLWPFLSLYRIFGMFPISKIGNQLIIPRGWSSRRILYLVITIFALSVQILMLSTAIRSVADPYLANGIMDAANACIYYGHTLGNSMYMTWVIGQVPEFLASCKKIEKMTKKYSIGLEQDDLVKSCNWFFVIYTAFQSLGNVFYYYSVVDKNNATSIVGFERAFNTEFIGEGGLITAVTLCIGEFYCDMGWTFADLLLCLLSMILTRYFARVNNVIKISGQTPYIENLEALRTEHRLVCKLVEECNQLFSPLFLLNYVANIGYLFTRLFVSLTTDITDPNFSVKLESIYAFGFQIFFKLLLPSYMAANLHEEAKKTLDLIYAWPSTVQGQEIGISPVSVEENNRRILMINRFTLELLTSQTGISGCGYFIISKSFVVTLLSALVTYEVIILQFQSAKQ